MNIKTSILLKLNFLYKRNLKNDKILYSIDSKKFLNLNEAQKSFIEKLKEKYLFLNKYNNKEIIILFKNYNLKYIQLNKLFYCAKENCKNYRIIKGNSYKVYCSEHKNISLKEIHYEYIKKRKNKVAKLNYKFNKKIKNFLIEKNLDLNLIKYLKIENNNIIISKNIRYMKLNDPKFYEKIINYYYNLIKKYNIKIYKKQDDNFIKKVFCYIYNYIPKCQNQNCNNEPRFTKGEYKKFCSIKCAMQNEEHYKKHIEKMRSKEVNEKRSKSLKEKSKEMVLNNRLTSLKKYGVNNPSQRHLYNLDKLNKEFVLHNFFTQNKKFLVKKFMNFYGYKWDAMPYRYLKKWNIKYNKNHQSESEIEIKNYIVELINKDINKDMDKVIQSERKLFYPKELDIFIPEKNLAIEFDGLYWHSEGLKTYKDNIKFTHLEKTKACESKNINLLHIFENEWLDHIKQDIWKSIISYKLGIVKHKYYARKLQIKEVPRKQARSFLNENHLQGACNAKVNLGLYNKDELISLMTFSKPRYNKNYEYELIRFVSKKYDSCIGCAQRLFKFFIKLYNPKSIISYANRRFAYIHKNIYKTLGFNFINESGPNYYYFHIKNPMKLYHRSHFQKYKLKKYEDTKDLWDPSKTEFQIMSEVGYRRIYDCGQLVYQYEIKENYKNGQF